MSNDLPEIAILNNVEGVDMSMLSAQKRFYEALKSIADDQKLDTGMGMGEIDFWLKIAGKEWYINIKTSEQQS